jgi:hypothetical protein
MALDLGELVAYLVVDDKRWNFDGALKSMDRFGDQAKVRAKTAGDQAGDAFGDSLVPEAERAGEEAGEKAGDGLKAKGALGAAAAGALVGMAFVEALDVGASADKLVAQLGANARQAERYGRVAGNLYAGAWGDSMDHVNEAIGAVVSSIDGMDDASGRQLGRLTSRALDFATAFEVDVTRSVQVADTMIEAKLAKNGVRAFDLLTRGAQKVPSALREDLLDTVEEYGQFFTTLGFTGPQAFALLVDATTKGKYGIDKAGDAIKEFTILATDGAESTTKALDRVTGGAAQDFQDAFLMGGDVAQAAFQDVVKGLLSIEDPSKQAQTAIALFGAPLEDLNVKDIPDFLRNLQAGSDSMDGFRGSSKRMSDELNGNARTDLTSFTRTMKTELVGYLEDKVIPVLEDDVIPAVKRFGDWFEKDGGPALRDFKDDLDPVIDAVGDLAGFLNDMPGEAKLVALGGVLAGGAALKVRGGGKGALGTAGAALGLAKPVPVFVTNQGFGAGGGVDVPGGGGKGGGIKGAVKGIGKALPPVLAVGGSLYLVDQALDDATRGHGERTHTSGVVSEFGATNEGYLSMPTREKAEEVDELVAKVNGFQDSLDIVGSTKVRPDLAVPGLRAVSQGLSDFIDLQIEAGKPVHAAIFLTGVERAMAQIASLDAGIDALGERGLDNGVPYVHGGNRGRRGGDGLPSSDRGNTYHFHGDMRPADSREFWGDVSKKSRRHGRGGFQRP